MIPILENLLFLMEVTMAGRLKNVGQLWKGEDKNKNPMLSGNIDMGILGKFNVIVLKNGQQKESTHPDYLVFVKDGSEEEKIPMPPKGKDL